MKATKINGINPFEYTWGISAKDLAESEGVDITAIFMRISRFGTPFQRRMNPTKFEAKYGKTEVELAEEMDMHPQSLCEREKRHGDIYRESKHTGHLHERKAEVNWRELPQYQKKKQFWLMPQHPDYARARKGGWNNG